MQLEGVIKFIDETKTYGNNGFRKRDLVITTDEQYPQHILIEFVKDKCDVLNGYMEGQKVKIGINLKGREWINPQGEVKYFNSIQGWRIEALETPSESTTEQPPVPPVEAFEPQDTVEPESDQDDLPF